MYFKFYNRKEGRGGNQKQIKDVVYKAARTNLDWDGDLEYMFKCIFSNTKSYMHSLSVPQAKTQLYSFIEKENQILRAAKLLELDGNIINLLLKQRFKYKGISERMTTELNHKFNTFLKSDKSYDLEAEIDQKFVSNFHDLLNSENIEKEILEKAEDHNVNEAISKFIINLTKIRTCYSELLGNEVYSSNVFKSIAKLMNLNTDELMGILCIIIGADSDPRVNKLFNSIFGRLNIKTHKQDHFLIYQVTLLIKPLFDSSL